MTKSIILNGLAIGMLLAASWLFIAQPSASAYQTNYDGKSIAYCSRSYTYDVKYIYASSGRYLGYMVTKRCSNGPFYVYTANRTGKAGTVRSIMTRRKAGLYFYTVGKAYSYASISKLVTRYSGACYVSTGTISTPYGSGSKSYRFCT